MIKKNSIECWIYNSILNKYLLLKCPETDYHPVYWQPVTGGLDSDESNLDACVREVYEETGIQLAESAITKVIDHFVVPVPEKNFEIHKPVYLGLTRQERVVISEEHTGYRWCSSSEIIPRLLWESNRNSYEKINSYLMDNIDKLIL